MISRHEATERDRDRQRQRQQRAQMLPDSEKVNTNLTDLFQAPVKVKIANSEIANTLGSFDTVRHLILDTSQQLIGVGTPIGAPRKQGPAPALPVAGPLGSSSNNSSNNPAPTTAPSSNNNSSRNHQHQKGGTVQLSLQQQQQQHQQGLKKVPTNIIPNSNNNSTSNSHNSTSNSNSSSNPAANNSNSVHNNSNAEYNAKKTVNSSTPVGNALLAKEKDLKDSGASNTKPAIKHGEVEISNMLKEMMEITPPITEILTPVKETPKFNQRYPSSKVEDKIVQSIRNSGMADVPPPVEMMNSSESSSSNESETSSDSESGDSSNDNAITTPIPKITPGTNSTTRWNLGSFIRKNDFRGTEPSTAANTEGSKSPLPKTSPAGETPIKNESVVSSTDTPVPPPAAEPKSKPYVPPKQPLATTIAEASITIKTEKVEEEKTKKSEPSRPPPVPEKEKVDNTAAGKRKRKRSSISAERNNVPTKPPPPPPVEETSPENSAAKNTKNDTLLKLFNSRKFNKKPDSPSPTPNTNGDKSKEAVTVPNNQKSPSVAKTNAANASVLLPPPPPPQPRPVAKIKEEPKPEKSSASKSSLVVKINLSKLKRLPSAMPAPPPPPPLAPPPIIVHKVEKDRTDSGAGKTLVNRVHHNSSHVGSSSSLCSGLDFRGKKRSKSKKVKSPIKKPKTKHEPDSHTKEVEEDCGEVSSNFPGYATCESDAVQAPDSSLTSSNVITSPVGPLKPVYYSYFEKTDNLEDYYSRDQESYLEEAKRLKHKADGEREITNQASMYLEAGLFFILTGLKMESTASFVMFKDTLVLIRYIGSRFGRNRGQEFSSATEAKIIVLSMRCQSMLSLKLFKLKMRETKEVFQYLQDHFQRHPTLELPPVVANSPQLMSTPSPHSPTSSPSNSSLHPSPSQIMTTIPRSLYGNMQKTSSNAMHLISAHELWEAADHLVEKYRIEEFFIQLDRQFGPLTLHNSLVDLVRYVKQALQILKSTSELS